MSRALGRAVLGLVPSALKDCVKEYLREHVGGDSVPTLDHALSRIDSDATVIFDIGANVGGMTLRFLERFPAAQVYAFEPCKETFEQLKRVVAASPSQERVKLFNYGFLSEAGNARLNITSSDAANSLVPVAPEYQQACPHIEETGSELVRVEVLDDFVRQHQVKHIDLMKIDVEGVELDVLKGARHAVTELVDVVICEISFVRLPREDGAFIDIFRFMHECGFAPAEIYDVAQGDLRARVPPWRLIQFDCVFRRIHPRADAAVS